MLGFDTACFLVNHCEEGEVKLGLDCHTNRIWAGMASAKVSVFSS